MTLISVPANPVPEGAVTGVVKTQDGVAIRFARWPPPPGRKGTVCILNGRTEFIEKYFEVIRELTARGFAVATFDWRGQGLSDHRLRDRRKGHVANFAEYMTDLETFMREVALPDCPPPLFGLAISMGAAVLLQASSLGHRWFERMILCAPMLRLAPRHLLPVAPALVRTLRSVGLGSAYVPGGGPAVLAAGPFAGNPVTSDPLRHARTAAILEAEPALGIGGPTVAWADAAFRTMAEFDKPPFAAKLRQPMLLIACGRDQLVSTLAIEEFGRRMRVGSHLIVPGAKHELLMERDTFRGQFWAAFDAYTPGTPPF